MHILAKNAFIYFVALFFFFSFTRHPDRQAKATHVQNIESRGFCFLPFVKILAVWIQQSDIFVKILT